MIKNLIMSFVNATGYLSPSLLGDAVLLFVLIYACLRWIHPIFLMYQESKEISKRGWSPHHHPLWGHLKVLTPDEQGMNLKLEWVRKYRDMLVTWAGPFKVLVEPHTPTSVSTVLLNSSPKDEFLYGFLRPWIGDGLLTSSGKKWKRHRKLLTPAFHFEVLKSYMKINNRCASVLVNKWKLRGENEVMEICPDVAKLTLDVMLQCAMSAETDCQMDSSNGYVQAVHELAEIIVYRVNSLIFQLDWIFWLSPVGRRFKKALNFVHSEAEHLIRERREALSRLSTNNNDTEQLIGVFEDELDFKKKMRFDFIDILLRSKDEEGNGLNDREIRDEVDTFLFEGHDTTSSAISWILYNLARHPGYQERCREEVLDVMGDREYMEWNDLNKLSYLTMCIKESLRLHSPVQIVGRKPEQKITFTSKHVPGEKMVVGPNTSILVNLWALHRNPEVWENPEHYNPDRFLPENISKMHPTAFVAFSAGPRNCIGKTFAMNEIKTTTSLILRNFKLFVDKETPKPRMTPKLVLRSENGIHIKIRRLSTNI